MWGGPDEARGVVVAGLAEVMRAAGQVDVEMVVIQDDHIDEDFERLERLTQTFKIPVYEWDRLLNLVVATTNKQELETAYRKICFSPHQQRNPGVPVEKLDSLEQSMTEHTSQLGSTSD